MRESKPTPGPWRPVIIIDYRHAIRVVNDEGEVARVVCGGDVSREEAEANARLIAAAPDLLATLEALLPAVGEFPRDPYTLGLVEDARAAIRKARGEDNTTEEPRCGK